MWPSDKRAASGGQKSDQEPSLGVPYQPFTSHVSGLVT